MRNFTSDESELDIIILDGCFLNRFESHGRASMDAMMTKTSAEIYLQQGHLQEAYEIFRVLSEKDPSNIEIQKRLKELSEKLQLSPSLTDQPIHSADEKIRPLERWLDNIREKKKE